MEEAVQRLKQEAHKAKPGQDFAVRRFEPGDAWAVARCFYEVYEEHYPFDTYYVPEKLIEANRRGDMIGVVAVTETGDIIAFGALFRNFAHNPKLYETGQATVIPEYRGTLAVLCVQEYLFTNIAEGVEVDDGACSGMGEGVGEKSGGVEVAHHDPVVGAVEQGAAVPALGPDAS